MTQAMASADEQLAAYHNWTTTGVSPEPATTMIGASALGRVRMNDPLPGDERLIVKEILRLQADVVQLERDRAYFRGDNERLRRSRDAYYEETKEHDALAQQYHDLAAELDGLRFGSLWHLIHWWLKEQTR